MKEHTHKHKCSKCSLVWEHPDEGAPTAKVYQEAHTCPGCGTEQREKYRSSEAPTVAHCTQYEYKPDPVLPPALELLEVLGMLLELEQFLGADLSDSRLNRLDKNRAA